MYRHAGRRDVGFPAIGWPSVVNFRTEFTAGLSESPLLAGLRWKPWSRSQRASVAAGLRERLPALGPCFQRSAASWRCAGSQEPPPRLFRSPAVGLLRTVRRDGRPAAFPLIPRWEAPCRAE